MLNLTQKAWRSSRADSLVSVPSCEPPLVEGPEVLVEAAGIERVPGVVLGDDAEVDEPVGLEGLPEVAGRPGRNAVADLGDPLELLLPGGVLLPLQELPGLRGVPMGEQDDGVAAHGHGPELLLLVVGFGIVHEVERGQGRRDLPLDVVEALAVDLVVEDGVPRGPLLHELGEDAGFVGVDPLLRHLGEDAVPLRAALPEGDDLVGVDAARLLVRGEGGLLPVVEILEVLEGVDADLGIGRGRLGRRAPLPDDELAVVEDDGLALHDVLEGQGVPHRRRQGARLGPLVELGEEPGPLGADRRPGLERLLSQLLDAFVHGHPPRRTSKPAPRKAASTAAIRSSEGGSNFRKRASLPMRRDFSMPPEW